MNVQYFHYKPDSGFEEIQATIYNEALKKYGKDVSVTTEQINQRYKSENTDPQGIRYAIKDDKTPLAYIQTRVTEGESEKRTYLGYPWAINDCPPQVQERLFDEMFEYVKTKNPGNRIFMGYWLETWSDPIEFAKSKGFEIVDENPQYSLDIKKAGKANESSFTSRLATENDLNIIVDLIKSDPIVNKFFPNEAAISGYLKDRVLPDGHTILIFKDEELVCSGAPLKGFSPDGVILRFSSVNPKYEVAWNVLIIELCKHMIELDWNNPFLLSTRGSKAREDFIKSLGAVLHQNQLLFGLKG